MLPHSHGSDAQARYVLLGGYAQHVVNLLVRDTSDKSLLAKRLRECIAGIEAIVPSGSPPAAKPPIPSKVPFQDYEQMSTLFEVLIQRRHDSLERRLGDFRGDLEALLADPDNANEQREEVLGTLRQIVAAALTRSQTASHRLSKRARELCQAS